LYFAAWINNNLISCYCHHSFYVGITGWRLEASQGTNNWQVYKKALQWAWAVGVFKGRIKGLGGIKNNYFSPPGAALADADFFNHQTIL